MRPPEKCFENDMTETEAVNEAILDFLESGEKQICEAVKVNGKIIHVLIAVDGKIIPFKKVDKSFTGLQVLPGGAAYIFCHQGQIKSLKKATIKEIAAIQYKGVKLTFTPEPRPFGSE